MGGMKQSHKGAVTVSLTSLTPKASMIECKQINLETSIENFQA